MQAIDLRNKKIAIVAGGGKLPVLVCDQLQQQHVSHIILNLQDNALDLKLQSKINYEIVAGQVKHVLEILRREEITSLVFAGHIQRPGLLSIRPDSEGIKLLAKITAERIRGDNAVLSIVAQYLKDQGFEVLSPNDIMPRLITQPGFMTKTNCTDVDMSDILLGVDVLKSLSSYDIGQAIVVENGLVLAIECSEGTDQMILRAGQVKREQGDCGVLVKMKKVGQNEQLDLPTIGVMTIENVHKAGLKGVALSAGASLIIDTPEVIRLADKYNIFIVGLDEKLP